MHMLHAVVCFDEGEGEPKGPEKPDLKKLKTQNFTCLPVWEVGEICISLYVPRVGEICINTRHRISLAGLAGLGGPSSSSGVGGSESQSSFSVKNLSLWQQVQHCWIFFPCRPLGNQ